MSAVLSGFDFRPDAPDFLRDPPEHTRLRRLASKVFHLQSMNAMRPVAEELTQWLLERIGARREIDFVADFAGPRPALVIMAMLGVPKEELAKVKRLSDDMALFIGSTRMSQDKYDIAESATRKTAAFFLELIQDRKKHARGGPAHLTVGFGMHICLGFPLARMEGQVALPAAARRWKSIELALPEERLDWLDSMVFRGMKALPIRVSG